MKLLFFAFCLAVFSFSSVAQPFRINEVMSSNGGVLTDIDGDPSDWIEFYNSGSTSVNLNGYGLSDEKANPLKWTFPDLKVNPGEYMLVFASGKDLRETPVFWNTLIAQGDSMKYLTPKSEPNTNWRSTDFDDSQWKIDKSGFGFGDNDDATVLTGTTTTVFIRKTFTITNLAAVTQAILHMDYDDGFVAYLNGKEIARAFMTDKGEFPAFNTLASDLHEALIYQNQAPEQFIIDKPEELLKEGLNTLAIQVHNNTAGSSDLTAIPFLSIATTEMSANLRTIPLLSLVSKELHTNFKISADGESVYLTDPLGVLVDSVRTGVLHLNYSYGRSLKDSSVWSVLYPSSPGKENSGEEVSGEKAGIPTFSIQGGVYSSGFKVKFTAPNATDSIYYTLNGATPTRASGIIKNEIELRSTKVIKARILKKGFIDGDVVTNSYIIYNSKKMPVVSVSMKPDDLWDFNTGIYVKGPNAETSNPYFGSNFWMDWEKPCHFELMETNGTRVVDQNVGVKIFGNWSRANDQKSLALFCRKSYSPDNIKYKIFKEKPIDEFKNIVLRNGGNDWNNSMFRDGLMADLTLGLNFSQQAFRPAILFLNGDYWGIQNIREKNNEHFIASNYGVKADKVTIVELDGLPVVGSADEYLTMIRFIESNSLATQTNYTKMLGWIDVNSFIDYYSSEIYCHNHDWPGNNILCWKTDDPSSRWRWMLKDTDFGFGIWNTLASESTLDLATDPSGPGWPNPPWSTLMFRRLLENSVFRNQFINRFADLLNSNFTATRVNKKIDQIRDAITGEIGYHLIKWNGGSKSDWLNNVLVMKNFATERPAYVFGHIQQKFSLKTPVTVTARADSTQGTIQFNSLKLMHFPWSGSYFPDIPIKLTAIPNAGFRFVKWTGVTTGSNSETISVSPKANLDITAVFESDGSHFEDIVINEISFNNAATSDPGDWVELFNKGNTDIDISGWTMSDSDPTHQFVFPANTWIKAGEYLVVASDLVKIKTVFGSVKNLIESSVMSFGLGSSADALKLYSSTRQLIDEVDYDNSEPWKITGLEELWSLELTDPWKNNNTALNWEHSENFGTPGAKNHLFTSVKELELPIEQDATELMSNYPNPFDNGTYIEFKLSRPGKYLLSILDVNGRSIRTLSGNDLISNVHTLFWDGKDDSGRNVSSGIYFYRLQAGGFNKMKRMVKM